MPRETFTPGFIKAVSCPPDKRNVVYSDQETKGLILEVRLSSGKTYYIRYRNEYGAQRKIKIGDATSITLKAARSAAIKTLSRIAEGEDPLNKKREQRAIPQIDVFYNERYLPFIKNSKRSWETDATLYKHHVASYIGHMHADAVTQADIYTLYHGMRNKGYAVNSCNRVFALVRRLFNLMIQWGVIELLHSPTKGMDLFREEKTRERFLNHDEILRLFAALKASSNPQIYFLVAFLLLTGARRSEATHAAWEDFDFDQGFWRIPKTKAGVPRRIPLGDRLLTLLDQLPSKGQSTYLFPNPDTGEPYRDLFGSWNKARRKAGLADVRMHDLRHSFASFLVNSGRTIYEVQKLLGHSDIKITERYAHLSDDTLRRAANSAGAFVHIDSINKSVDDLELSHKSPHRPLSLNE